MLCVLTACTSASARLTDVKPVMSSNSQMRLSGELTLKGSEFNAWFALRDDDGRVWRLESDDEKLRQQMRDWQNRRVKVLATPMPKLLATDRVKLISISLE